MRRTSDTTQLCTSNKGRSWRKLHFGVDGEGFVVTSRLTDSGSDDALVGVGMFDTQEREAMIGVLVIYRMKELGMPKSVAVVN